MELWRRCPQIYRHIWTLQEEESNGLLDSAGGIAAFKKKTILIELPDISELNKKGVFW